MSLTRLLWTLLLTTFAIGCQPPSSDSKTSTGSGKLPEASAVHTHARPLNPKGRASRARESLFDKLSTQLLAAMSNGGPARAVEVCSKLAPRLAAEVGREHGLQIGRTSLRLRSRRNAPPAWAENLLAPDLKEPLFIDLPDQKTGALFPILLKVQCLTCHGPEEQIADDIRTELKRLYPDDQATGFREGDLRGWFWVEVSPEPVTSQPDDHSPD